MSKFNERDVANLVVIAREFWEDHPDSLKAKEMDKALEPFSALVPYENEPELEARDD